MAATNVDVYWVDGLSCRKMTSITQKHVPIVWECMLGTVYARSPEGIEYCNYDYKKARELVEGNFTDLRLVKSPRVYNIDKTHGLRHRQLAVWGIPVKK